MSRPITAKIKDFWDKTAPTDNKLIITNRTAVTIQKIREKHNITEGKAVDGLINGTFKYEDVLKELQKDYKGI